MTAARTQTTGASSIPVLLQQAVVDSYRIVYAARSGGLCLLLRGRRGGGRRRGRGCDFPVVTRVTGHLRLGGAVGELGIDVGDHRDHHARGLLLRLLVAGIVAHDVAVEAVDSERLGKLAHDTGTEVFGLENLKILRRTAAAATL